MDKIKKFLATLSKEKALFLKKILADVINLKLTPYDVKPLKGLKNVYRLRKGKVRIIFAKGDKKGVLLDVTFRKDAYN